MPGIHRTNCCNLSCNLRLGVISIIVFVKLFVTDRIPIYPLGVGWVADYWKRLVVRTVLGNFVLLNPSPGAADGCCSLQGYPLLRGKGICICTQRVTSTTDYLSDSMQYREPTGATPFNRVATAYRYSPIRDDIVHPYGFISWERATTDSMRAKRLYSSTVVPSANPVAVIVRLFMISGPSGER